MKRTIKPFLFLVSLVLVPARAAPQTFEALSNPNVVAGASYLTAAPSPADYNRVHFFLTANIAGIKLPDFIPSTPCYLGGLGLDLRSIDEALGQVAGAGMSVPGLTCYPGGKQFVVQIGYTKDLLGAEKPSGIYGGVGFSLTSSKEQAIKRAAKKAAKKAGKKRKS